MICYLASRPLWCLGTIFRLFIGNLSLNLDPEFLCLIITLFDSRLGGKVFLPLSGRGNLDPDNFFSLLVWDLSLVVEMFVGVLIM